MYETENGEKNLTVATNLFLLAENVQWHANFFDVHFWHNKFSCQEIGCTEIFLIVLKIEGENFSMPNFSRQKIISKYSACMKLKTVKLFLTTATNFFHLAENVLWHANFFDVNFWNVFLSGNRVQNYVRIFSAPKKLGAAENLARKINRVTVL